MASISPDLENFKCSNCTKFLSYYPIYSDKNQNSICGRCQSSKKDDFYHNNIFEISMENFQFPCTYHLYGCDEQLFPKDVPSHENFCEFKMLECPVRDATVEHFSFSCDWQGLSRDIYEHFEQNHPKYILQDGKFEADLISNYSGTYLYAFGQEYFMFTKNTDTVKKIVTCTVEYLGTDEKVSDYNFKITLKTPDGKKTLDTVGKIGENVEISITTVMDLLSNPVSILAEVDVYEALQNKITEAPENNESSVNYDLLEEIKCLVCSRYMVPPIYQCETGHSICSDCSKKTKKCPTCGRAFNSTQNFALCQVILHMSFPCMYTECNFSCRAMDIRKHEASCSYRPIRCPVNESTYCDVKPIFSKIGEHLISNHGELILTQDEISCFLERDDMMSLEYIIPYHNKIFILHFNMDVLNDSVSWVMEYHSSNEDNKSYQFAIDIIDHSGNNRRLYFRETCLLFKEKQEEHGLGIHLTYDQLKPYLKVDTLFYNIRIIEDNKS